MIIDTDDMVSMTEANQNFSQVVKKVEEKVVKTTEVEAEKTVETK